MTGYSTSALTTYVQENQDVLIKDVVLGNGELKGAIIPKLNIQTGVKTSERIHYMNTNVVLQEANGCGFNPNGGTEFSDRDITTGQFKVNDQYCPEDLLAKFNEYKVRIGANEGDMPYEAEIMDAIVLGINKQMEIMVWQGDTTATGRTDLINGFLTQAEGADSASTIVVTAATGTSVYARIKDVYMQIPEKIVDDAAIFISPALFRQYVQELVSANLYHYDPAFNGELTEMWIPGSSVKVYKTYGLTGSDKIYATTLKNMYGACDMENAKEEIKLWFSDDDDIYKLKVRWNFGVATLYPDMVLVGTVED